MTGELFNNDAKVLVLVEERATGGEPQWACDKHCGFNVKLTDQGFKTIRAGGRIICHPCALKLALEHPEAFKERASDPR